MNELLTTNFMISNINKINTGSTFFDNFIIIIVLLYIVHNYNPQIIKIIMNYNMKTNSNIVILECIDSTKSTHKYRAIMHYIAQNCEIQQMKEYENRERKEYDLQVITVGFKVNQTEEFIINKEIIGRQYFINRDIVNNSLTANMKVDVEVLELSSKTLNVRDIIKFIDECDKMYLRYTRDKNKHGKLIIDISWNQTDKCIDIESTEWQSNVKFSNRFFEQKENILKKINFFINNKEWYKNKGIPHTLGILLWGDPGCGKTGFIKALANYKNFEDKHIINIKLSSSFDLKKLNKIINSEEICNDLIIPLNKRIIIFEDIDCMSAITDERDKNITDERDDSITDERDKSVTDVRDKSVTNESNFGKNIITSENKSISGIEHIKQLIKISENINTNNLSYLLNIIDGLTESTDRIIIMTSNYPEKLDKALIRSGRIDLKINFKRSEAIQIKNIINNFWDENLKVISNDWSYLITPADIINDCKSSSNLKETLNLLERRVTAFATINDIRNILNNFWNCKQFKVIELWNNIFMLKDISSICQKSMNIDDTLVNIKKKANIILYNIKKK